jgi:hypothetical protein
MRERPGKLSGLFRVDLAARREGRLWYLASILKRAQLAIEQQVRRSSKLRAWPDPGHQAWFDALVPPAGAAELVVESVAGSPWNGWPNQRGIGGRMGVEYARLSALWSAYPETIPKTTVIET